MYEPHNSKNAMYVNRYLMLENVGLHLCQNSSGKVLVTTAYAIPHWAKMFDLVKTVMTSWLLSDEGLILLSLDVWAPLSEQLHSEHWSVSPSCHPPLVPHITSHIVGVQLINSFFNLIHPLFPLMCPLFLYVNPVLMFVLPLPWPCVPLPSFSLFISFHRLLSSVNLFWTVILVTLKLRDWYNYNIDNGQSNAIFFQYRASIRNFNGFGFL